VKKRPVRRTVSEYLAYLSVIGVLVTAILIYERSALNNAQADQLEEVNDIAEGLSRRLAAALTRKSVAASGIAQTVSLLPSISQDQFSTITSRIIDGDPSVVVTSLISDWHITHVHPLVGNESTIGSDLRGSTARVEAINRVFDREHGVVQGPVRLLAGVTASSCANPCCNGHQMAISRRSRTTRRSLQLCLWSLRPSRSSPRWGSTISRPGSTSPFEAIRNMSDSPSMVIRTCLLKVRR
jgi:hypothetical protein